MFRRLSTALLTAATLSGGLVAGPVPGLVPGLGDDTATHTFRSSPFNANGLASLEELRGKPVLIEFWGTR